MKQNPCRYCALSWEYGGKHYPADESLCVECENIKKHREYLKSKRMFEEGAPITSLEELLKQEWVMLFHHTRHIKFIKNIRLLTILNWLDMRAFHMAIKIESEDK